MIIAFGACFLGVIVGALPSGERVSVPEDGLDDDGSCSGGCGE